MNPPALINNTVMYKTQMGIQHCESYKTSKTPQRLFFQTSQYFEKGCIRNKTIHEATNGN